MLISNFNYHLPHDLIAQSPANPRDHSKLLVINRETGRLTHKHFYDIVDYLKKGDVLVLNKTKVFPARFFGNKKTGGKIEVLLIEEIESGKWKALTKPGLKDGQEIFFKDLSFKTTGHIDQTVVLYTKTEKIELLNYLDKYGHTPLPPYIHSKDSETKLRTKYQTVYAEVKGSVAAPTAGFHFTKELMNKLVNMGVQIEYVTLHVGLGTFAPVKTEKLEDHPIHHEYYEVEKEVALRLNKAKESGKRIISVGTTTTRVLETLASNKSVLDLNKLIGSTNLFIYPPYKFNFIEGLITNFHLPESTLLSLVSAFTCYPNTKDKFIDFEHCLMGVAYKEAISKNYRFYSFGDASLII